MMVSPSKTGQIEDPKIPSTDGICGQIGPNHVGRDSKKSAGFRGTYGTLADALGLENGAQKRTRTSTPLRAPAPEAGASTNSAIWARGRGRALRWGVGVVNGVRVGA